MPPKACLNNIDPITQDEFKDGDDIFYESIEGKDEYHCFLKDSIKQWCETDPQNCKSPMTRRKYTESEIEDMGIRYYPQAFSSPPPRPPRPATRSRIVEPIAIEDDIFSRISNDSDDSSRRLFIGDATPPSPPPSYRSLSSEPYGAFETARIERQDRRSPTNRISKKKSPRRNSPVFKLSKSDRKDKKWKVVTPSGKTVQFGAKGYEDFTMHKSPSRMNNYTSRHRKRENWTKSGINSAGFWSKWLLWNKPSLSASIKDTEKKFNIKIQKTQ